MQNHHKKEFRIMRAVALWLYNFKCGFSGCTKDATEVHHINEDSSDNNLSNLIPLCSNHHRISHIAKINFVHGSKRIIVLLLRKIASLS